MEIKFLRAVKAGGKAYEEGQVADVDQWLAELLLGKGYVKGAEPAAEVVTPGQVVGPQLPTDPETLEALQADGITLDNVRVALEEAVTEKEKEKSHKPKGK